MKDLVGKRINKKVGFMGTQVTINKLSVAEVVEIQQFANPVDSGEAKVEDRGIELLIMVIRKSCEEAAELTDEDFNTFPLDELSKLSDLIMAFSGMGANKGK